MGDDEQQGTIPKPDVTDDHRRKAAEMAKAYEDDRPTVSLPGTANTVTGQAVADWVDDDGKPKHGEVADGGIDESEVLGKREPTVAEIERE